MTTYYLKDDIYEDLGYLNKLLSKSNLYLNLRIVGRAALLFNGIKSYETEDIDTLSRIEYEIKEIIDECSIDINDDVTDYLEEFSDADFILDDKEFSNISIEYLDLGYVIKTKMRHSDPFKIEALAWMLEDELNVEMTPQGLYDWLAEVQKIDISFDEVDDFLAEAGY